MEAVKTYAWGEVQKHLQELIDALRSVDYEQSIRSCDLRPTFTQWDFFGVACDVSGLGEWSFNRSKKRYDYCVKGFHDQGCVWPVPVAAYYGLYPRHNWSELRVFVDGIGETTVPKLVINHKYTFAMLADVLQNSFIQEEPIF